MNKLETKVFEGFLSIDCEDVIILDDKIISNEIFDYQFPCGKRKVRITVEDITE